MDTQIQVINGLVFKLWNNRILVYQKLSTFESYGMRFCSINFPRLIEANGFIERERVVLKKKKSPCTLLKKNYFFQRIFPLHYVSYAGFVTYSPCDGCHGDKKETDDSSCLQLVSCGLDRSVKNIERDCFSVTS